MGPRLLGFCLKVQLSRFLAARKTRVLLDMQLRFERSQRVAHPIVPRAGECRILKHDVWKSSIYKPCFLFCV